MILAQNRQLLTDACGWTSGNSQQGHPRGDCSTGGGGGDRRVCRRGELRMSHGPDAGSQSFIARTVRRARVLVLGREAYA